MSLVRPSRHTGRKLNVHKTFRRRPGRLMIVLCTFNLRPVSTGVKGFDDKTLAVLCGSFHVCLKKKILRLSVFFEAISCNIVIRMDTDLSVLMIMVAISHSVLLGEMYYFKDKK